jgi:hypothetical protein
MSASVSGPPRLPANNFELRFVVRGVLVRREKFRAPALVERGARKAGRFGVITGDHCMLTYLQEWQVT